jgi:multidrug resistance protein, MATE family
MASLRRADGAPRLDLARLFDRPRWLAMFRANTDIMVRTLFLLAGFAWFTREGARFGDVSLAANHILLQLISFSAFFLDGYAFVVEALIGHAIGARDRAALRVSLARSTELAGLTAVVLAAGIHALGPFVFEALTTNSAVRAEALRYLPYASVYVLTSFVAFQLDGVFIGATATRPMRNTAIGSFSIFFAVTHVLVPRLGLDGLWVAFVIYVIARGVSLAMFLPRVVAGADSGD